MATTVAEIRSGAYYDSIILMQLQRALAGLPGILNAAVVMGTDANKDLLTQSDLLTPEVQTAGADDLVIVVKAKDDPTAQSTLEQVDDLLTSRKGPGIDQEYLPKSLETAAQMLPNAQWVLVSVPGRYAANVSRQALGLGKHVFLFSDNVSLDDEIELKQIAVKKGLLIMGPDCGTAIVNGVGMGFANRIRSGPIGLIAASGTGLQQVSARLHQMGSGISHALGTGGRDLTQKVNALTAQQAIDLLSRDQQTNVIVLISKPPASDVADKLVRAARLTRKPVVVNFIGYATAVRQVDNVYFAATFDETAKLAVQLATSAPQAKIAHELHTQRFTPDQRYLRGLFSGGTLAYEAQLILKDYLPSVYANAPLDKDFRLADTLVSQAHTIVDLGEDEFTVGRLHPMMDNDLRIHRLEVEASDPQVAVILLDVVLGYGAHPDPAGELAPAIARARSKAEESERYLEVVAVITGTDEDPQDLDIQITQLEEAGAVVFTSNDEAARYAGRLVGSLEPQAPQAIEKPMVGVNLNVLHQPLAAINVGLESFTQSLAAQDAPVIQVDWRPPAGGNQELMAILERMKNQ